MGLFSAIIEILKNISKILPNLWRKYEDWSGLRHLDKKAERRQNLDDLFRAYEKALKEGDQAEIEKAFHAWHNRAISD